MVKTLDEQNERTDKDGLDRAYVANVDISSIDNTLYIVGTKIGRAIDWYDNLTKVLTLLNAVPVIIQYKSCMLGM